MTASTPHRLFHTLILVGTSAAACGGSTTPDGSGGAEGSAASGGAGTGGSTSGTGSSPGTTSGGDTGSDPDVPLDHLPCPPQQWSCDFTPCRGWPTANDHCECDPSAPLTAGDCDADEDFTCAESSYDSEGVPLEETTLWACGCEPRLVPDDCCNDERWHDSAYSPATSGCTDEPGPREVVCSCLVLLR